MLSGIVSSGNLLDSHIGYNKEHKRVPFTSLQSTAREADIAKQANCHN